MRCYYSATVISSDPDRRQRALGGGARQVEPCPLYYQLAQAIEAAIRDGELSPGDRFENELALAKRLTLSRPTTRRAIQELVDKGLLVRKRGVGTQVVQNPVHRRVELTSLSTTSRARPGADHPVARLPRRAARRGGRARLSLTDDREVVSIHRLRCANGEPLALMTNYLPVGTRRTPRSSRTRGCTRRCAAAACISGSPGNASGPAARRRAERQAARREARRSPYDGADRLRRLGHGRRFGDSLLPRVALLLRHHPRRPLTFPAEQTQMLAATWDLRNFASARGER